VPTPRPSQFRRAFVTQQGRAMKSRPRSLGPLRKVPEITLYFWIVKLLTTAMGESTSDYLLSRAAMRRQ
jgi:hypothetical protein